MCVSLFFGICSCEIYVCSYLVYSSFSLIVWLGLSVTLVINLLGASRSKAQMVVPCGTVSGTVLVTPLVTLCSWKSLSTPRVCSAPVEFAVSGLLWSRLLAQTCFCKCSWSGSAPVEVPGLGLVLQRSPALIFSLGGPRLRCT